MLTFDANGKPTELNADRYEFWLYRQIRKRFQSGEIYLDDSLQHRHFSDELVSMSEKASVLAHMDIPFIRQPVDAQLDELASELTKQWLAFNRELKAGKLKHLDYDKDSQTLIRPAGQIDLPLIISEKPNIDQIVATLGLKEMTQGALIRKLCTYTVSARQTHVEFGYPIWQSRRFHNPKECQCRKPRRMTNKSGNA
mgnify:FL=1